MTKPVTKAVASQPGRIVIVGASLAGLGAARALREEGFAGALTIVGDEPDPPYDRPPLSKQVLRGRVPAEHTALPRRRGQRRPLAAGHAATGLDRAAKRGACWPTARASPTTGC